MEVTHFREQKYFAGGVFLLRLLLPIPFMVKCCWFLTENCAVDCSVLKIIKIFVSEMQLLGTRVQ